MIYSPNMSELSTFLTNHTSKKSNDNSTEITHTRIGNPELNIYGGSFHIPTNDLDTFYKSYYDHIFVKKRKEYLTEKQIENGPVLIDLDFRYNYNVTERQHSTEHIQDIIGLYLDEINKLLQITSSVSFPIFVMEKPNVNRVADKQITKDGIHIIIGIQMDHTLQCMLREKIISVIGDIIELPLENTWENVLDEGISKGCVNWQMYGSQKPGNEAYKLVHHVTAEKDATDNEFMTTSHNVNNFNLLKDYKLLSAQYDKHHKFEILPSIMEKYNKCKQMKDNQRPHPDRNPSVGNQARNADCRHTP